MRIDDSFMVRHGRGLAAALVAGAACGVSGVPVAAETNAPVAVVTVVGAREGAPPAGPSLTVLDTSVLPIGNQVEVRSLSGLAPNFSVADSGVRAFGDVTTMRGTANTPFFGSPGTVVYLDDVPLGPTFAQGGSLWDPRRVDVLRGPRSTAFGFNAPGGVVRAQTALPGNDYRASASFGYGSFDAQSYEVTASGPVVKDRLSLALHGYHEYSEGFIENTFLNKRADERDALGGRGVLRWTPTEEWDIRLTVSAERFDDGAQPITPLDPEDRYQVESDLDAITQLDTQMQALRIERRFDWGRVVSITARQDWDLDPNTVDLDLSPANLLAGYVIPGLPIDPIADNPLQGATSTIRQRREQWSQEIRFESPPDDPSPLSWDAGFFFMAAEVNGTSTRSLPGLAFEELVIPFFGTFLVPVGQIVEYQDTAFDISEQNYALFGNAGWELCRGFELKFGMRLDLAEREINRVRRVGEERFEVRKPATYTNIAPEFGFEWECCDMVTFHGRTGLAFKPGGFSAYSDIAEEAQFDTESIWANEIGVRFEAWGGKLRLGATAFWNEVKDYQVERSVTFGEYVVINAPEVTARGVEVELLARPFEGFVVGGNFGLTQAQFDDYRDPYPQADATGVPIPGAERLDYTGNEVPFVPAWTASVFASYRHACGAFARVEGTFIGDTFYDELNSPYFRQSSYGLLGATVGYEHERFSVALYGCNLTGTEYFSYVVPSIVAGNVGAPQAVGFKVTLKY